MEITLFKISSVDLACHPAYAAGHLRHSIEVCRLLGVSHTFWSQEEVDRLGKLAARGEFNMMDSGSRITLTIEEPAAAPDLCRCDNCGFEAKHDDLPEAKKLSMRLEPGGTYTDVECPECGALCFPVEKEPDRGLISPFNDEELLNILEFTRAAMQDADTFDDISENMDVAEDVMIELRDKLQRVMGRVTQTAQS